jgi:hypothetical protein
VLTTYRADSERVVSNNSGLPSAWRVLRQHRPDLQRNFQELGTVGVVEQDNQFPVFRNSLYYRLEAKIAPPRMGMDSPA